MPTSRPTLFAEASAHLPLFDSLPAGSVERLAGGGLGRGLLTAALRARLRKAGFADMGALALATPIELTLVRKIGPVRVQTIRAHILDALARLYPDARAIHGEDATAGRRLDRLRAVPAERLPLEAGAIELLGCTGRTSADVALRGRCDSTSAAGIPASDLDGIVAALVRLLLPDRAHERLVAAPGEDDAAREAQARRERAEMLRQRDREWDEAAPVRHARPTRRSRA